MELRWDALNFRKPNPDGTPMPKRDAYFTIDQVKYRRFPESYANTFLAPPSCGLTLTQAGPS